MNWKEEFGDYLYQEEISIEKRDKRQVIQFIESLLEEQRKELTTQLPDELKTFVRMSIDNNWQFTEEQVIKAEVAWHKLMERRLVEQQKYLINKILSEAPEDKEVLIHKSGNSSNPSNSGFNQANQLWKSLLTKHLI